MDRIDTSGKALVDHWTYAADKGIMNSNTATSLRVACTKVLEVLDGWESLDVRAIDLEDVWRRFVNKRNKDFKPESLEAYRRRFTLAVKQFLEYADDPSAWKPSATKRPSRKARESSPHPESEQPHSGAERTLPAGGGSGGLVEYPFPLREGRFAYLRLPTDLKAGDVKRLTAYLNTLAMDTDEHSAN